MKKFLVLSILMIQALVGFAQTDRQRYGNRWFKQDNYVKAEAEYRKAVDKNPSNPQALYNLGCALLMQKKDSAAIQQFEHAGKIETDPKRKAMAYHNIGWICQSLKMYGKVDLRGKTVCALLSGGNVDVTMLERIITRGLAKAGRTANFATVLPDQPKTLATLLNIVSDMGVNVLEVNHERGNLKAPVGSCVVHLLVETRDAAHVQEMYEALRAQGYPIMER